LTPNAFLTLSKFCWACESYRAAPNIDTFCTYFELQKQLKKVTVHGVVIRVTRLLLRGLRRSHGQLLVP
jgi:hypothetical protein